ncbi:MAG TPA: alkene reductase [Gammaproteobacteria bacterium]|nr:alkene reductase [Gammaproteobacteria bacterium]HBF08270.1 alkene reductase [Gammaproteobacteria bacterium]HCK92749.1 alkene reductase [Gammaproteobacteria bacterium]|tara:strand:- start:15096 stop:16244 length:1149 start_codon:yes stop_codon:yes gene_type:complete
MAQNHSSKSLLNTMHLGNMKLNNRVFMAPLTRSRSNAPDHTQTPLHALYYAQRATAGLIISEATQISQQGQGYAWTPGLFTDEQVESWKPVTDAIHNAGGHIFVQLWHVGAISHNVFQPNNTKPVSASAWTPEGQAFVGDYHPDGPQLPHPEAHELTKDEIKAIIEDYKNAARHAIEAGFDGVEFHAANGYLIDQFMRDSVNKRTDEYGGSIENRLRLLNEVVDALREVLPAHRIGVRLTPKGGPGGSFDSNPATLYTAAAKSLSNKGLAYLHVVRPNSHVSKKEDIGTGTDLMTQMKQAFGSTFIINGEFTPEEAEAWVNSGKADAVAFGRMFIANPDLPERIAQDGPYNQPDPNTFYGGNEKGYTDYESLHKSRDQLKAS